MKCAFELQGLRTKTLLKECTFLCLATNELSLKKTHQYYAQIQMSMHGFIKYAAL